jgi:hypothetical protein
MRLGFSDKRLFMGEKVWPEVERVESGEGFLNWPITLDAGSVQMYPVESTDSYFTTKAINHSIGDVFSP